MTPLQADTLIAAARASTGLHDFGDPAVEPALSVLTRSLREEAQLNDAGECRTATHRLWLF